ncbi:cyclin-dependent kinase Cdk20 [Acrasis kona]|uniref:cyclin-dependent kinase n=1 Tax=Acrasis kona TaxID=1008807 RepID=A0AAW2YV73_9EUKA
MRTDLSRVLKHLTRPLQESHVKTYARMLLRGLDHCHSLNIMHRDVKPANLLISPSGILKLGDFGLATIYVGPNKSYSHQVATRAPELLYGSRSYDQSVDMWSAGCVIAEMLNHSPLFPGENDIDQLHTVLKALGSPTQDNWPGVRKLPDYNKITFTKMNPVPMNQLVPNASPHAIDLLSKLLVYDSEKRYTAKQALQHPFFHTEPYAVHYSELQLPQQPSPPSQQQLQQQQQPIET